ncbi:Possible purine/pyrimidine phosphoribosyltransferase [hydrothermal vent metagenome]|uniref:Possible purine/pyrimidine phosphoribosyltransferase n=1 Tax=hydrothermal vent metagenome TaxID=652676 RepID=A0A3B1E9I1_9ZZZZ
MRCLSCENLSWLLICKNCQNNLLKPSFYKRRLLDDFFIYSFYNYDEIKEFINSKYQFYGDKIFNILGSIAFQQFANNFEFTQVVTAIPIDDHTRHDFSQSAILAKHLKSKFITPVYGTLKATNIVKYAGKDLNFRQRNKRNLNYNGKTNLKIILVDDLVTTGLTILESKKALEQYQCEVLFALTLSDANV